MSVTRFQVKVSKGDTILTSKPFVYILNSANRSFCCDHCLKRRQGLQRCSGCSNQWYCDKDCQRGAWFIHRLECKNMKRIQPIEPPDTARLLARVVLRMKNGGDLFEETITGTRTRKFKDLMNHFNDIKEDKKRYEHFLSLAVVLHQYLGEENMPNEADLMGMFGRICVNSFNINDDDLNAVGTGVYLAGSIFDHSCKPNAFASFDGTNLTIRSLVDWDGLDWNKLRISYIDIMNTNEDRLEELHRRYYFWCDCKHCHDEERAKLMSSIICGNKSCPAPVYIDIKEDVDTPIGPCKECGFADFSPATRPRYYEVLEFCRDNIKEMENKSCCYLDISQKMLEMQEDLFHNMNVWRAKALDNAFESAIGVGSFETAKEYGVENLEAMRYYYGEQKPAFGMTLLKLGKICDYLGDIKQSLYYLEEAEPLLKIGLGRSHPAYTQLAQILQKVQEEIRYAPIQEKLRNARRLGYRVNACVSR